MKHGEPEEQSELGLEASGGQTSSGVGGHHEQATVGKGSGFYSERDINLFQGFREG